MSNFKIIFEQPLFFLILIPVLAFVLWLYFRMSKKFRRTRNNIISLVLQVVVILLSVSVLVGTTFAYEVPNHTNEVILLVDVSHSNEVSQEKKDDFVKNALENSDERFQMGVVIFGREAKTAVDLGIVSNVDAVYNQYTTAVREFAEEENNTSATNIEEALLFASDLLSSPKTAKIVLLSDGLETDGDGNAARDAAAVLQIRIDTVFFDNQVGDAVQLIGVEMPGRLIELDEEISIGIRVKSSFAGPAAITMTVNDEVQPSKDVRLREGEETFTFAHTFKKPFLNSIKFTLTTFRDSFAQNKTFYAYHYVDVVDGILILENNEGEGAQLASIISIPDSEIKPGLNVIIENIADAPMSLDILRNYNQIILMNIANADMPEGFDEVLYDYVHNLGGGLLTVGGNKTDENGNVMYDQNGTPIANTYNIDDMNPIVEGGAIGERKATLLQEMLPVEAINYTPPIAVMIVIDRSGSMIPPWTDLCSITGKTAMEVAKDGAREVVNALSERDYVGVISFAATAREDIRLTSVTQRAQIENAIAGIQADGGTVYRDAIEVAAQALAAMQNVVRRHIIFLTDGEPNDIGDENKHPESGKLMYEHYIDYFYKTAGITLSAFAIQSSDLNSDATIKEMAKLGNGRYKMVANVSEIPAAMRIEAQSYEIRGPVSEAFTPRVSDNTEELKGISGADIWPQLGGYYGVRKKTATEQNGSKTPLVGDYAPLYVRWSFGEGRVGSFLSTLNGDDWSSSFMNNEVGKKFIKNMVKSLLPVTTIEEKGDIKVDLSSENYTVPVVLSSRSQKEVIGSGESIEIKVNNLSDSDYDEITAIPKKSDNLYVCDFAVTTPGVYMVEVIKTLSGGEIETYTHYFTFSYSAEFNKFPEADGKKFLAAISARSKGSVIDMGAGEDEQNKIFADIRPFLDKTTDPSVAFIIIALVLFLLDIAVRKFKFKWPWEIVSDRKMKKELMHHDGKAK